MMEQRRLILFLVVSTAVVFAWSTFVVPMFMPPPARQPAQQQAADKDVPEAEQPAADPAPPDEEPAAVAAPDGDAEPPAAPELPEHPRRDDIVLGSLDPDSGYFVQVVVTSEGAAVSSVTLNDRRFRQLQDMKRQLEIVKEQPAPLNHPASVLRTLQTAFPAIDGQLEKSLNELDWELVNHDEDGSQATFRIRSPDGRLEIEKRYTLQKVDIDDRDLDAVHDAESAGYQLGLDLTVRNLADERQTVNYVLQGPVGVPLENQENARKFRDLRMGFLEETGRVRSSQMTAGEVAKKADNLEEWRKPVRYIGVDMQYFAALLVPQDNQLENPYIESSRPMLVERNRERKEWSDVSVELESRDLLLEPGAELTHSWTLYAGPKRQALLAEFGAADIVDFGWFSAVSKGMLWLLNWLHSFGIAYGLAIIGLTIIVRGMLFPLSKKQAAGAKKMKELQPKLQELKKKYGDDKEKMARAQMELFSKHNYNPFAGCLPIFLQLPIFIGLYSALNSAVDLRLASFLWIDNLAAPDQLFRLPFALPYLGQDFNLLPLLTVGLFVVQQKMFMPPPADEQQAMQYKMMNYMMIFMGFLFYHMPAGLCIYFIASSLWGIGERKMLDFYPPKTPEPPAETATAKSGDKSADEKPPTGFWGKLIAAAESAANETKTAKTAASKTNGPAGKKKKSRQRR